MVLGRKRTMLVIYGLESERTLLIKNGFGSEQSQHTGDSLRTELNVPCSGVYIVVRKTYIHPQKDNIIPPSPHPPKFLRILLCLIFGPGTFS
jgi:hypothetical protein